MAKKVHRCSWSFVLKLKLVVELQAADAAAAAKKAQEEAAAAKKAQEGCCRREKEGAALLILLFLHLKYFVELQAAEVAAAAQKAQEEAAAAARKKVQFFPSIVASDASTRRPIFSAAAACLPSPACTGRCRRAHRRQARDHRRSFKRRREASGRPLHRRSCLRPPARRVSFSRRVILQRNA